MAATCRKVGRPAACWRERRTWLAEASRESSRMAHGAKNRAAIDAPFLNDNGIL